jgi:predicted DNA-binding transcriptional regulator AlpA
MDLNEIKIAGHLFEDANTLMARIGIKSDTGLRMMQREGMPKPIRVGRKRYWDRFQIDAWLLKRVK